MINKFTQSIIKFSIDIGKVIAIPEEDSIFIDGDKIEIIDIPVGYTHNIQNIGDTDMITVMWANEIFNPEKPDTYFMEV